MNVIYENATSDYSANPRQYEGDTKNGRPTSPTNGTEGPTPDYSANDLKILGHIKNIEKINEKRRNFLSNNITEYSCDEKVETESSDQVHSHDIVHTVSMKHTKFNEKIANGDTSAENTEATSTNFSSTTKAQLRSPPTPPPKPPMLSRPRSIGADAMGTPTDLFPPKASSPQLPITITATTVAVPEQVTHVELREAESTPGRTIEPPTSATPKRSTPKEISISHYERLVGELKCPGCAYPMKTPILLCMTGHSICEQCTRVLMLCPLCKEPFTNLRSLTIEALCSKAHFRCQFAKNGCTVRLQIDLLGWHEKQCIFKPMKCFMGRVWGDCQWNGCEVDWKEHLETDHASKVFATDSMDLIWNMQIKQKPLTGYYVFIVHDQMFNFYEIYDHQRVLFTMTCTSSIRDTKNNYAFEVTITHEDNEALAITQKFPVHSEYDKDILAEGTCVSIPLSDLAKFIAEERLLHYRVRVLKVKNPPKLKALQKVNPNGIGMHPIDYRQTQIEGVNLKNVPTDAILTRQDNEIPCAISADPNTSNAKGIEKANASDSESELDFEDEVAKTWGTPQLNFHRKYLKNVSSDSSSNGDTLGKIGSLVHKHDPDDRLSIASTNKSYKSRMTNTLRRSFRALKAIEMKPLLRRSPVKSERKSLSA